MKEWIPVHYASQGQKKNLVKKANIIPVTSFTYRKKSQEYIHGSYLPL